MIESGLLDGHYVSDPRKYRRVTKNPINNSETYKGTGQYTVDLDDDIAFFC